MVRVILETSIPLHTVDVVRAQLEAGVAPGVSAALRVVEGAAGCQRPAFGGTRQWTPCWLTVEAPAVDAAALQAALLRVKALVTGACREGGMEIFCLPATAQIGDEYRRFRDVLDVALPSRDG